MTCLGVLFGLSVKKIANVDKKQAPFVPIKRPNPAQDMKLKKGKTKIHKYINNEL